MEKCGPEYHGRGVENAVVCVTGVENAVVCVYVCVGGKGPRVVICKRLCVG